MKQRIYLDTSVISAYFDERNLERMKVTKGFWRSEVPKYDVIISQITLDEITATPDTIRRGQMVELIRDFVVVHYTDESRILRDKYMEYGLVPPKYIDDAGHVAIASVAGAHYLVSWNFEHLIKIRTKRLVGLINTMYGYPPIELVSPYEFGGGE